MTILTQTGRRRVATVVLLLALSWTKTLYSAQSVDLKPEKNSLEVAIAAYGPLYLPLLVAQITRR